MADKGSEYEFLRGDDMAWDAIELWFHRFHNALDTVKQIRQVKTNMFIIILLY